MKQYPPCYDCLLSRAGLECSLSNADEMLTTDTIKKAEKLLTFLQTTPYTHPVVASHLHKSIYRWLNVSDPFKELKDISGKQAEEVFTLIKGSLKSFHDFALASVIGNVFDYGVKGHHISSNFKKFFKKEFTSGFYRDDTDKILKHSSRVVYFTDNCGEIVFDRALIKFLKDRGSHVTLVVKDKPILNDATLEDAIEFGLTDVADETFTTGSDGEIGVRFDRLPMQVLDAIDNCTLILSKGMANYESLREEEAIVPIAYLLAAKCIPIAEELNVPIGSKIAHLRNPTLVKVERHMSSRRTL